MLHLEPNPSQDAKARINGAKHVSEVLGAGKNPLHEKVVSESGGVLLYPPHGGGTCQRTK